MPRLVRSPRLATLPILVVEDSRLVRDRVTAMILEECPPASRVRAAATVAEVRGHLTEHQPETVVPVNTTHPTAEVRASDAAPGVDGFVSRAHERKDFATTLRSLRA